MLDVLKPNLSGHVYFQSKVLVINRVTFVMMLKRSWQKGNFSHYNSPCISLLYETAGLYICTHALQKCTELPHIKHVVKNFQTIIQDEKTMFQNIRIYICASTCLNS